MRSILYVHTCQSFRLGELRLWFVKLNLRLDPLNLSSSLFFDFLWLLMNLLLKTMSNYHFPLASFYDHRFNSGKTIVLPKIYGWAGWRGFDGRHFWIKLLEGKNSDFYLQKIFLQSDGLSLRGHPVFRHDCLIGNGMAQLQRRLMTNKRVCRLMFTRVRSATALRSKHTKRRDKIK